MNQAQQKLKFRLNWVRFGIFLLAGLIFTQLFRWQVLNNSVYEAQARALVQSYQSISSRRGVIYASDMSVLSIDEPAWAVYVSVSNSKKDQEDFKVSVEETAKILSEALEVEQEDLKQELEKIPTFYTIKHGVSERVRQEILQYNLPGVHFQKETKRVYPNGKLAANILGFVGKDSEGQDDGKYGITGYYWGDLLGFEGYNVAERDIQGNVILKGEYNPIEPEVGKDIVLTIDPKVQRKLEEGLKKGVIDTGSKAGSAIVMDPQTGEIIAMASYPTYDPNDYSEVKGVGFYRNRAVSDAYEFGSVNKAITVATAMEQDEIDENYTCTDNTGYLKILDHTIYTWDKRPDGTMKTADVLRYSNNPCAVKIGLKLTPHEYYDSLKEFGLLDKVGLGLEDEGYGYCPPYQNWSEIDLATASYGQMFSATPIQVISAISAIANHGDRMQPYVVKEIQSEGEDDIIIQPRIASEPLSPETADKVAEMMSGVVKDNYYLSQFKDYKLAGKTGTAQIPKKDAQGYEEDKTNATFVGFGPYDDPQFIMLVKLNQPKTHSLASYVAVPLWADIFDNIKNDVIQ